MKIKARLQLTVFAFLVSAWPMAAQTVPPSSAKPEDEQIVKLSPFEVTSSKDVGYQATQTLAGTRINSDLKDVGSAIQAITKEFMNDIGATGNRT